MHLIMNALEEVTSRAHPNVSEISLLITLVSASAGFEPAAAAAKNKKIGQTEESQFGPRSSSSHLLPFPAVFAAIQVLRAAPSEEAPNTFPLPAAFLLW